MSPSDKMVVLTAIRQVELQRVSAWMLQRISADLDELQREVVAAIQQIDVAGTARADFQRSRLSRLLAEIEDEAKRVFDEIKRRLLEDVAKVEEIQVADEKRNWLLLYGLTFTGDVEVTARKTLVLGAPLPETVDAVRDDFVRRASSVVRQSAANAEPTTVTAAKVKGDVAVGGTAPVAKPSKTSMEKVVRTSLEAAASKAAGDVKPPKERLPPLHWVHVSVLDSRTTHACRQRAYRRWDENKNPVGHALPFQQTPIYPPEHPCRSRLVRYFEGDQPPTQRASFRGWLDESMTPEQQDKVFGKRLMALWRKGLLTDTEMIRQSSRPLAIDALRKITEEKGETQSEFPFL